MNRILAALCMVFGLTFAELVKPLACSCAYTQTERRKKRGAARWKRSSMY
jgi:hypothetical protein